jgi:hypothetical protein
MLSWLHSGVARSAAQYAGSCSFKGDTAQYIHIQIHTRHNIRTPTYSPTPTHQHTRHNIRTPTYSPTPTHQRNVECIQRHAVRSITFFLKFKTNLSLSPRSIAARAVLEKQWEAALNPTSEAKQSLSRLRALEEAGNEGGARDAELAFLSHCSPCWNRSFHSPNPSHPALLFLILRLI